MGIFPIEFAGIKNRSMKSNALRLTLSSSPSPSLTYVKLWKKPIYSSSVSRTVYEALSQTQLYAQHAGEIDRIRFIQHLPDSYSYSYMYSYAYSHTIHACIHPYFSAAELSKISYDTKLSNFMKAHFWIHEFSTFRLGNASCFFFLFCLAWNICSAMKLSPSCQVNKLINK